MQDTERERADTLLIQIEQYFDTPVEGTRRLSGEDCDEIRRALAQLRQLIWPD